MLPALHRFVNSRGLVLRANAAASRMPQFRPNPSRRARDALLPSEGRIEVIDYTQIVNNDTLTIPNYGGAPFVIEFEVSGPFTPDPANYWNCNITGLITNAGVMAAIASVIEAHAGRGELLSALELSGDGTAWRTLRWWDEAARHGAAMTTTRAAAFTLNAPLPKATNWQSYLVRTGARRRFVRVLHEDAPAPQ